MRDAEDKNETESLRWGLLQRLAEACGLENITVFDLDGSLLEMAAIGLVASLFIGGFVGSLER